MTAEHSRLAESPTASGPWRLWGAYTAHAETIDQRLINLFRPAPDGRQPSDGPHVNGPLWTGHPTFSEYFNGDTGEGPGASQQTGWTDLVAHLLCRP